MEEFIEKLVARFEEEKGKVVIDGKEMYQENYLIDIDDAISITKELAEEYKGGWIPCIEKQPPKPILGEDTYWVQESDVVEPFSAYWNGEYWTNVLNDKLENVLAWQPLPGPYKAEEPQWKKAMMNTFLKR